MTVCAVAWDIDGTLVDSEPVHLMALKATCRQLGTDISDLPDDRFVGVNMHDVWDELRPRLGDRTGRQEFLDMINRQYCELAHKLRPMPHAPAVLSWSARRGLRQVAVSNSARIVVDANLSLAGLGRHMEFSLSLDDVPAGKPAPDPYLEAARRLELAPAQIVAVEDSETGAQSARSAGLVVIRIDWSGSLGPACPRDLRQVSETIQELARPKGQARPPDPSFRRRANNKTQTMGDQS